MKESKITNMKITNVSLSMADHGCLTFRLTLEGGGCGVGYGGYCIGHGYLGADKFEGDPYGIECLMRIMDTVGVEHWEDLKGKYIRIVDNGWGSTVTTIGHIIEDKWFNVKEFFERKYKEEKEK